MTETPQRRARRQVLTDIGVAALKRRPQPYFFPDPALPKFGVRIRPSGEKAYYVITRDPYGKQRWVKVASTAEMDIETSREEARSIIARVKKGLTPREPPPVQPESVEAVIKLWLERHVEKAKLRSAPELRRVAEKYVLPYWAEKDFTSIKRRDVVNLTDLIEGKHGPAMADVVTKQVRSIMNWFRDEREETYVPPPFSKKKRVPLEVRKRSRVLDDDELRRVWRAAEDAGAFGVLVKLLLSLAQRRDKVLTMRRSAISPDGTWTIPKAPREKGTPNSLLLPPLALGIVRSMRPIAGNDFVFAGNGDGHKAFNFARDKTAFDDACGVQNWRLHDCRRTARSLMSKAGVRPDVAELVLGHAVGGVKEIYDHYDYAAEMADALRRLAALIEIILTGEATKNIAKLRELIDSMVGTPTTNVVKLRPSAAAS
jgi:integrase